MTNPKNAADAFNDCIERLHQGQSVQQVLDAYPQHAASFAPLLQIAVETRRQHLAFSLEAEAAKARQREAVLKQFRAPVRRQPAWARVAAAAALLLLGVGLVALLTPREQVADEQLTPLATLTIEPSPTPTLSATPTPSSTATGTSTSTATATVTASPTATATLTATATVTASSTATATLTATATPVPPTPPASSGTGSNPPPPGDDDDGGDDDGGDDDD